VLYNENEFTTLQNKYTWICILIANNQISTYSLRTEGSGATGSDSFSAVWVADVMFNVSSFCYL